MQVEPKRRSLGSGLRGYGLAHIRVLHPLVLHFLAGAFSPELFVLMVVSRYWRDYVKRKLDLNRVMTDASIVTAAGEKTFKEYVPMFQHVFVRSPVFWKKLLRYRWKTSCQTPSYNIIMGRHGEEAYFNIFEMNRATYMDACTLAESPRCDMLILWIMLKYQPKALKLVKLNKIGDRTIESCTAILNMITAQPRAMGNWIAKGRFIGNKMQTRPERFIGVEMPDLRSKIQLWVAATLWGSENLAMHYWCVIREGDDYIDLSLAWDIVNRAVGHWQVASSAQPSKSVVYCLAPMIVASYELTLGHYYLSKRLKQMFRQYQFWNKVPGLTSLVTTYGIPTPLKAHGQFWAQRETKD